MVIRKYNSHENQIWIDNFRANLFVHEYFQFQRICDILFLIILLKGGLKMILQISHQKEVVTSCLFIYLLRRAKFRSSSVFPCSICSGLGIWTTLCSVFPCSICSGLGTTLSDQSPGVHGSMPALVHLAYYNTAWQVRYLFFSGYIS